MRCRILVLLLVLSLIPMATAQNIGVNLGEPLGISGGAVIGVVTGDLLVVQVNSSQFWDDLDSPADIFLNDLGDVDVPSPSNGQVLTFQSSSGNWIASDSTGGGNVTQNLTNVAFKNETNNFTEPQLIDNHLNVTGNLTSNDIFGEVFFPLNEAGLSGTFAAVDVYENLTFSPNAMVPGEMNGVIGIGDVLIVEVPGTYSINYEVVFTGKSSTDVFTAVRINGVVENKSVGIKGVKNDDEIYTITGTDFASIRAGETVQLVKRQRGGSAEIFSIFTADLNIRRVGDNGV